MRKIATDKEDPSIPQYLGRSRHEGRQQARVEGRKKGEEVRDDGGFLRLDASNSDSAERVSITIASRLVTWYVSYSNEPGRPDARLKGHEMNLAELEFTFTSSKALLAVLNVALHVFQLDSQSSTTYQLVPDTTSRRGHYVVSKYYGQGTTRTHIVGGRTRTVHDLAAARS